MDSHLKAAKRLAVPLIRQCLKKRANAVNKGNPLLISNLNNQLKTLVRSSILLGVTWTDLIDRLSEEERSQIRGAWAREKSAVRLLEDNR